MTRQVLSFTDETVDPRQLRNALGQFATGVTVVTTCSPEGKLEGLTANSFSAVSLDPPLVLWSIKRSAPSLPSFESAGMFAINILDRDQADISHHFASPAENKFEGRAFERGAGGCPLLPGALATFECRTEKTVEGGDHLIFIGRILRASYRHGDPLLFSSGRYSIATPLPTDSGDSDLASMWDGLG